MIFGVAIVVAGGFGYGGFGVMATFPEMRGLNRRLTELNHEWGGRDSLRISGPMWWLTGHGAAEIGQVTIGGWGAVSGLSQKADSVGNELLAVIAAYEMGYQYSPVEYCWVRPCVDLRFGAWFDWVHSLEPGQSNFSRWFLVWDMALCPGLEVMGRLRFGEQSFIGLFAKGSYMMPFVLWEFGDSPVPDFRLQGFALQAGLRFGKMEPRPFRM